MTDIILSLIFTVGTQSFHCNVDIRVPVQCFVPTGSFPPIVLKNPHKSGACPLLQFYRWKNRGIARLTPCSIAELAVQSSSPGSYSIACFVNHAVFVFCSHTIIKCIYTISNCRHGPRGLWAQKAQLNGIGYPFYIGKVTVT